MTITWSTDVPSTSEVDYGLNAPLNAAPVNDSALRTEHRIVLTDLTPDTTYFFVAHGSSAGGAPGVLPQASFVTTAADLGPDIGSPVAQVTSTTASIEWTTPAGSVSQVEYGTTPNYESSTLLQAFPSQKQRMMLTGLQPRTAYHFRVKSWDGAGFLNATDDQIFSTGVAGLATLLGATNTGSDRFALSDGQTVAYAYPADQTGQASRIQVYVEDGSGTAAMRVALFADLNGAPGSLLTQASASGPFPTGWVSFDIPQARVEAGARYWLAVLSPPGGGGVSLRDAGGGGTSLSGGESGLTEFSTVWRSEQSVGRSALSAYVEQVPPSVTLTATSDTDTATATLTLSALVDDDASIRDVEFLADGAAIAPPLSAPPYRLEWDSSALAPGEAHTVAVRATDSLGRSGASPAVTIRGINAQSRSDLVPSTGGTGVSQADESGSPENAEP